MCIQYRRSLPYRADRSDGKGRLYCITASLKSVVSCPDPTRYPVPSAREKGLVKNDTILGPLRHSGYVTTMPIAISWPASRLHMTTCWIWLTKYRLSFAEKVPYRKIEFYLANNWQKYTHSRFLLQVYY